MALNRTLPIEERIKLLQAELDALIDAHALEVKKNCDNVPLPVIRAIEIGHETCQCAAWLRLKARQDQARGAA